MAWEGERTVTFTMEDALISPVSFSILSGAGLIEANEKPIIVHTTEQVGTDKFRVTNRGYVEITLKEKPYIRTDNHNYHSDEDFIYVMVLDENGEVKSEPYIAVEFINGVYVNTSDTEVIPGKVYYAQTGQGPNAYTAVATPQENALNTYYELDYPQGSESAGYKIRVYSDENVDDSASDDGYGSSTPKTARQNDLTPFTNASAVLVDYYVEHKSGAYEIDITPDKFGGNFYLEASTLFRAENGQDMPAEFIIPNCKVQSNFTFSMASSGDPSTFTFTMDAFPDYTRWNKEKKVFAAIQVIDTAETNANVLERLGTPHNSVLEDRTTLNSNLKEFYETNHKPFIEID